MKRVLLALAIAFVCVNVTAQSKFLMAGASSSSIVIIDRETQKIEWRYDGITKQCNSAVYLPGGNVAYTNFDAAQVIEPSGKVLWEYKAGENEQVHSISAIRGGYLVGVSGTPARVVELDANGAVKKELSFDTGITNIKRQFRQITKTINNTYVIPIADAKRVVEINAQGRIIKDIYLDHTPFFASTNNDGDWLITCGHAGSVYKVDRDSGEIYTILYDASLGNGIKIGFSAGITALKNGNYLLANWVGHNGDQTQPILIEITDSGEVVWTMNKTEEYTFVASVCAIY